MLFALLIAACTDAPDRRRRVDSSDPVAEATDHTSPSGSEASPRLPPGARPSAAACEVDEPRDAPSDEERVEPLAAVQFVSTQRGWVVGSGVILRTDDGGESWEEQYSGAHQLTFVNAIDDDHVWATGADGLLASRDGGECWRHVSQHEPPLQMVHFVDPRRGWGITGYGERLAGDGARLPIDDGAVVTTRDGGRSWQHVRTPVAAESVCFTDERAGWFGGRGRIYRTRDGGRTWRGVLSHRGRVHAGGSVEVQCAGPRTAWALTTTGDSATGHSGYTAYLARDGRRVRPVMTERFTSPPDRRDLPQGPGTYPGPFSAIAADAAMFIGMTPTREETASILVTDGGTTLGPDLPVDDLVFPTGAAFITTDVGWVTGRAVDGSAQILATTDGGRTWSVQYSISAGP